MSQQSSNTTQRSRGPVTGTAIHPPHKKSPFFIDIYRTAVGKKYVMAITGLIGLSFIFFHMIGNLKMYLGPVHFDEYADWLRTLLVPFLPRTVTLWLLRLGIIGAVFLHIHAAYSLTVLNKRARPVSYHSKRDYIAANYASRTMRWTGVIFLLFLLWHLFDLSWTGTGYHYVRGHTYANLVHSLDRWPVALLYLAGNLALGFHLFHGVWSLFQSLGWNSPRFNKWRRGIAAGFTVIVIGGNLSFPIMILAGVVGHGRLV